MPWFCCVLPAAVTGNPPTLDMGLFIMLPIEISPLEGLEAVVEDEDATPVAIKVL